MRRMLAVGFLALVASLASGCATMARGMSQDFEVVTEPPGAKVETSLNKGCEPTPCKIAKVSREAKFAVTIIKPGYETLTQNITHETSAAGGAAVAASFAIPGGVLWSLIDMNFGASQDLKPNPLNVTLKPSK
ncbi:MAG TPA: PEGA domain-containing protein [Hyphomonadaceae bacterium]|nr:PEGA domain-containing protein [Hyphomonadaceae bacterium]